MAKSLGVMVALGIGLALSVAGVGHAVALDEILLANGGHVTGQLQETEFSLTTPTGTHRLTRANAWRLNLGTATGDAVDLRNGSRISGRVEQAGYTLRLAGGQTRAYHRGEVAVVTLGAADRGRFDRRPDVLVLVNGDHVYGDVVETDFDVALPTGTQRFNRDHAWRMVLNTPVGDTVELKNGDRVTGRVEAPTYAIRTSDGQTETYGRNWVLVVAFRVPEPVRRAAMAPGTAAPGAPGAPVVAAPPPTTVPPAALPPAIRAVLRDLHFEFDRWELTPEARRALEEVAAAMKAFPGLNLLIEGHADERGTPEYNLALGARRAQSARDYLVNLGIEATRLDMVSYGEERPIDGGHHEMAWALNRRAHFAVKAR